MIPVPVVTTLLLLLVKLFAFFPSLDSPSPGAAAQERARVQTFPETTVKLRLSASFLVLIVSNF